jgi:alkylation response protein AidB-like acyl-CoA dehydrogenase
MTNLARERLVQAVRGVVVAETVIGWTITYTRDRKAFGGTIADFQNTVPRCLMWVRSAYAGSCMSSFPASR